MTLDQWINEFLAVQRNNGKWVENVENGVEKAYFSNWYKTQEYLLKQFRGWARTEYVDVELTENVQPCHINGFLDYLRAKGNRATSCRNTLQVVHHAVRWGTDRGYFDANLLKDWPNVRPPKIRRRVLREHEVEPFLEAIKGFAIEPLVVCALYTGLRRSEIIQLRIEDVDFRYGKITVQGDISKTGDSREVPLHDRARAVLEKAINGRDSAEVFRREWIGAWRPWSAWEVSAHFKAVILKLPEYKGLTFHRLRATFLTRLAEAGYHPLNLQRVAGHKSFATTQVYLNMASKLPPLVFESDKPHL